MISFGTKDSPSPDSLRKGIPEPEFYGDLVDTFKKSIGRNDFFYNLGKKNNNNNKINIIRYKCIQMYKI